MSDTEREFADKVAMGMHQGDPACTEIFLCLPEFPQVYILGLLDIMEG